MKFAAPDCAGAGVTVAIFGKSHRRRLQQLLWPSPIDAFASLKTGIDIYEIETSE